MKSYAQIVTGYINNVFIESEIDNFSDYDFNDYFVEITEEEYEVLFNHFFEEEVDISNMENEILSRPRLQLKTYLAPVQLKNYLVPA